MNVPLTLARSRATACLQMLSRCVWIAGSRSMFAGGQASCDFGPLPQILKPRLKLECWPKADKLKAGLGVSALKLELALTRRSLASSLSLSLSLSPCLALFHSLSLLLPVRGLGDEPECDCRAASRKRRDSALSTYVSWADTVESK